MIKNFKSFINESVTYSDAVELSKEDFYDFIEKTMAEWIFRGTPYMGHAPERIPQWIKDNFKDDEANISLHPENGNTTTTDETDNTLYFISKNLFYKVLNVTEKEYNEIYNTYIFDYDIDNPSSSAHDTYEE